MKNYFIRFTRSSILLLSIFTLVNTNAKAENKVNYITMQKENIIDKDLKKDNESEIEITEEKAKYIEEKKTTEAKASSPTKPTKKQNITKTNSIKYGTYGRLYVSHYSVALYDFNVNTKSDVALQTLVDNKDSAAYYKKWGKLVIADHYNQGFKVLSSLNEGTISNIKFEDGSEIKYKLIKKAYGTNTGPDLIDSEGNSFFNMNSDIIMYTCYNDGILATLWVLI